MLQMNIVMEQSWNEICFKGQLAIDWLQEWEGEGYLPVVDNSK